VIAERFTSQLLAGTPARDPVAVTRRLLAVQGQDARGVRLAIRARSTGLTAAGFDAALTEQRSLLITWLCRGTLHLVAAEDYGWLHALTTPPLATSSARQLAHQGVPPRDAERAVAAIERALADDGPLTRAQLGERVAAIGVRTEGQALIQILFAATLRGLVVRGPMAGRQHAYALVRDWLGPQPAPGAREVLLAELARRYLAGHAPASDRDLARWAGLPLRDARAGLEAISRSLVQREDGLLTLRKGPAPAELPPPRLLGSFDPLLVGWCSREFVNGRHDARVIGGSIFRPFAVAGGRTVGLWRLVRGEVVLEAFGRLTAADRVALQEDGRDVIRYLGM
jgi:Winged helix DNA-binding domain